MAPDSSVATDAVSLGYSGKERLMQIEGVPYGWELVGFRAPKIGEFIIDTDGAPYEVRHDVSEKLPVIRRAVPTCLWPHGMFADGWIAQDKNGSIWWYSGKPAKDEDCWDNGAGTVQHLVERGFMRNPPAFRQDIFWTDRIQQVGPTYEATLSKG
jgi:hypothetical protein